MLRPLGFFPYHGDYSTCRYYAFPPLSVICFGGWLGMSRVVPDVVQWHVCLNSRMSAPPAGWNLVVNQWIRLSGSTHRTLDRSIASWPRGN